MTRRVLLVEIGTTAELPVVTPPAPRPPAAWVPSQRPTPGLLPPSSLAVEIMADAAKLSWIRSAQPGAETVVEAAADIAGAPGEWLVLTTTRDENYTIALPAGPFWVRLYAVLNGRVSVRANAVLANRRDIGQVEENAAEALRQALLAVRAAADEEIARARDIAGVSGAIEYDPEVETPANTVIRTDTGIYRATQIVPVETPPANATYWHPLGTVAGLADGQAGQSSAIFDLQATTEEIGLEQALMAGALTDVQTELPGKASTQAVSLLQGEVAQIDGRTTANSNAITQVQARTGANPNLLPNGGFEQGAAGWSCNRTILIQDGAWGRVAILTGGGSSDPLLRVNATGLAPVAHTFSIDSLFFGVGGNVLVDVAQINGVGTMTDVTRSPLFPPSHDFASAGLGESNLKVTFQVQPATIRVEFYIYCSGASQVQALGFRRAKLERGSIATPYSADTALAQTASVTQTMRAEVDTLNNRALASWAMVATAGGDVAGMQLLAGGGVSAIRFLSEAAGFYSSDGSFEIANGLTIIRSGGFMEVRGKPFGQGNEMVAWYGPEQSNLANCRRSNAISFKTNTGLNYNLGASFSGTITAGGYTKSLGATSYATGAFGTNGNPIAVNASFTHSRRQMGGRIGNTKNTITAGAGVTRSRIELWRSVGGGAFELVASDVRTGVMNITNDPDPDIESYVDWNNTVSLTYTDNAGGTAARNYEIRLVEAVFQSVNIAGSAPIPPPENSRSLGVRSSE